MCSKVESCKKSNFGVNIAQTKITEKNYLQLDIIEHQVFTWKIENFDRRLGNGKIRSSLEMGSRVGLPHGCEWTCSLIRSSGNICLDTIQICLSEKPISLKKIKTSFRVKLKPGNRDVCFHDSKESSFVNIVEQSWTSPIFTRDKPITLYGSTSLIIEISIKMQSPKYKTVAEILAEFLVQFTGKLQADFSNMLETLAFARSDSPTVIVCKNDNTTFPANRGMLAARSNVFLRMFRSEMKEDHSGIVQVADVSSEVMKIILNFMYTGSLLDNWDSVNADELLYAAAKYEIQDLVEFLDVVIGQICTIDNAGKLMNLVKKLNLKRAETDLLNFIKSSAETFEQFEKFMNDAKSDVCFVRLFSANCVIQPAMESSEKIFNDCFEETDSVELEFHQT